MPGFGEASITDKDRIIQERRTGKARVFVPQAAAMPESQPQKRKRPGGGGSRSFPYVGPVGGGYRPSKPAVWWEEDTAPREALAPRTPQAILSSFMDFSKAVFTGFATSSAALVEAA